MTHPRGQSGRHGDPPLQGGATPTWLGKFAGGELRRPRVAGISRARWAPSAGAPSPSLRLCLPQRCPRRAPAGLPLRTSALGPRGPGTGSKEVGNSNSKEKNPDTLPRAGAGGSCKPARGPGLSDLSHPPSGAPDVPTCGTLTCLLPGFGSSRCPPSPAPFPARLRSPASGHSWCLHPGRPLQL